jgi:glyoxylase-like metal-dependent hydrolase (beta-lactamase superfamily II)
LGDLFCGDILGNTGKQAITTIVDDSAELEKSIKYLKTLEIKTVYSGHGKPFQFEQFMERSQ